MLSRSLQLAAGNSKASNAWDISKASYSPPTSLAWNLSTAKYVSIQKSLAELLPSGIYFKPDGLKMYIVGPNADLVYEYSLTSAWMISTASQDQTYAITEDTSAVGITFSPDGTRMYLIGSTNDSIYQYSLSTAWNISTVTFVQSFSVASKETTPTGVFFKPDGLKMYIIGSSSDSVHQYSLSTAWNISTASFVQSYVLSVSETSYNDLYISSDGTKMYVIGSSSDSVLQYTLSTGWDISTATFLESFIVSGQDTTPQGLFFKPDGSQMYIVGSATDAIYQYVLGGFSVSSQDGNMGGIAFKTDGTKMYLIGQINDTIFEYSLSTAWNISTATYQKNFYVGARDTTPTGLFFSSDGTQMFFVGNNNDSVYQYQLSTAWDTSTLTYLRTYSFAAQETLPNGLFFSSDGTQMYIAGNNTDSVLQYTLSTAWNISTASYTRRQYIDTQQVTIHDVIFKPDGKTMIILGGSPNAMHSYTLTTAWDISTATFTNTFLIGQEAAPSGLFFKDDGLQFFMCGTANDSVYSYLIS